MKQAEGRPARSGWLVGLIALAGGLAAPVSTPIAGPLAAAARPAVAAAPAGPVAELLARALAQPGADPELAQFYAARADRPLWLAGGRLAPQARELLRHLDDAAADGLDPAEYDVAALRTAVAASASGRPADLARAELRLSEAAARYGSDLHHVKPAAQLLYSDPAFPPPERSRRAVLERLAAASDLSAGLADLTRMNPFYTRLRAALAEERARGGPNVALIRANLERARALPSELGRRYILVDVTAQKLWTYEDGRPVDSMKVVVGKPSEPTPGIAALVRYAVFRPYWNVPPDLVQTSVAPKVLRLGLRAFREQHLQALSDWTDAAKPLDPQTIDWRDVAAGGRELRVRQLPGPDNMMGQVKFMFPNELGVYLHDSPLRSLFGGEQRLASAGCVRLEDALRLARWLLGDAAVAQGVAPGAPESRTDLPEPTPVYIVYFTAAPTPDGVSVRKDIYGRDAALVAELQPRPSQAATRLASR